MATKNDAERKALLEQAKRDLARENESDGEKKVRSMIREEIADALHGFFADDDEGDDTKPKDKGTDLFNRLLGNTGS